MHKYEIRARQLKDEMKKILDDNKVSSQLGLEEVNQEQFVIYKRLEFELYHLKRIIDFKNELKEKIHLMTIEAGYEMELEES